MSTHEAQPATAPFQFHPKITTLPAYVPGAGGDDAHVIKLASNEVPHPPAPQVVASAVETIDHAHRYPEIYADKLCHALAHDLGVNPESVIAGNGSVALLELVVRAATSPGDEVVYAWRSFEAYPIIVQAAGATSVQVPTTPEGDHDLAAMAQAVGPATKVVMVCNPNNPTSQALSHTELERFLHQVPQRVLVVVDEAYVHFDRTDNPVDGLALVRDYPNVIVLRTFSKAYGLAGLRVGYGVGRADLITPLRSASTPFGVNAVAAQAATAALQATRYTDDVVNAVVAERQRVVGCLVEQGWNVGHPQGNFVWLPIGDRAQDFAAEALADGFTVRPFPEGVRITIGTAEANDKVLELTRRWAERFLA